MVLLQNWSVSKFKSSPANELLQEAWIVESVNQQGARQPVASLLSLLKDCRTGTPSEIKTLTDNRAFNTRAKLWIKQGQICEHLVAYFITHSIIYVSFQFVSITFYACIFITCCIAVSHIFFLFPYSCICLLYS